MDQRLQEELGYFASVLNVNSGLMCKFDLTMKNSNEVTSSVAHKVL